MPPNRSAVELKLNRFCIYGEAKTSDIITLVKVMFQSVINTDIKNEHFRLSCWFGGVLYRSNREKLWGSNWETCYSEVLRFLFHRTLRKWINNTSKLMKTLQSGRCNVLLFCLKGHRILQKAKPLIHMKVDDNNGNYFPNTHILM